MSKTDTYATNDMKGKIDRTVPKVDNGKKTTVSYDDYSGTNSSNCQLCGIPSAMDMITAICGAGAISAVEKNQVFSRV